MKRTEKKSRPLIFLMICYLLMTWACKNTEEYYTVQDFIIVPKIDAHFHYLMENDQYIENLASAGFRILSPNVDSGHPIQDQLDISNAIFNSHPETFAYLSTFSVAKYGTSNFANDVIEYIEACANKGALGIKIWKNIGMELQDTTGRYVMITDPPFVPIFEYLETNNIPVMAHLGEPRDCWLPFDEMTDQGDVLYYKNHPQYHMYLHPEMPSYEDQIEARDQLLKNHPDLNLIGAHLGSLEWSVDELARRLDQYPNFNVDMAARIGHLKNQSREDWDRVRNFLIHYQDRVLYATDMEVYYDPDGNINFSSDIVRKHWLRDWIYLATDSTVNNVRGLKLPKEVINKIYYRNTEKLFNMK